MGFADGDVGEATNLESYPGRDGTLAPPRDGVPATKPELAVLGRASDLRAVGRPPASETSVGR